jgi:hypothetical protein
VVRPTRVFLFLICGLSLAGSALAAQPGASPAPADADEVIVRKLIESLKDPDQEVRQNIAVALAKIGTGCIDPLIEALKDANTDRRAGAAYALGLIGPPARAAMPALLDALSDKEPDVRRQVSFAIGRLIPPRDPNRPPPRSTTPLPPPPLRGAVP